MARPPDAPGLFLRAWDWVEQTLVGVLGLAALVIGVVQVVGRYFVPEHAITWAEEVIVYLAIWAIMIVSSQLVRTDGHVRPDVVLRMVPPRVQRIMEIFNCIVALIFCGGLIWFGWEIVNTALMLDETSSTGLEFPMWIYYASLPTGGALMFIRYVMRLVRYIFFFDPRRMTVGHTLHDMPLDMTMPTGE